MLNRVGVGRKGLSLTVLGVAAALGAVVLVQPVSSQAQQPPSEATVAAGLQVWRTAACGLCHGTFGNGEKTQDEAPTGANLRTTKIDAATMIETIKCGRPGTGMPYFDPLAWTKSACYGLPLAAEPPAGSRPPNADLNTEKIALVVAYIQAKLQGKPDITKADCSYYYGIPATDPGCSSFK
ncbi:MAG: hypothetical protein U1E56_08845 [Bauldia sp.]